MDGDEDVIPPSQQVTSNDEEVIATLDAEEVIPMSDEVMSHKTISFSAMYIGSRHKVYKKDMKNYILDCRFINVFFCISVTHFPGL